ncbi:MAG: glycosyltransferase family 4 protein, partial [Candidatus Thermoplasmatota archaeon]|nr:glycosyltransferase family 4 protein [Candidatus Thermoplasmatota archaeon]
MNMERPTPRLVPSASRLKHRPPPPQPQAVVLDEGPELDPHWHKKRGEIGLQFAASFQEDSIAHVIRELARATWRLGYEVAVEQRETRGLGKASWPVTSIRHLRGQVRPPMCIIAWGTQNCGRDFFGTPRVFMDVPDSLHFADAAQMHKYNHEGDLFLTVTDAALAEYQQAGLSVPGAVVPLGVDRNVFKPCDEKDMGLILDADWHGEPPDDETWLVLLAGYMQPRKGVDLALEAMKQVFGPENDVAILVKTVVGRWGRDISEDVAASLNDSGLRFGLLTESLPEHQFARLLASADCYLAPHRREGFGLIPLQALACGTPVVTTRYDGPATYLNEDNAVLIEPRGLECLPIRKSEDGRVLEVALNGEGGGDVDTWAVLDVDDIARAVERCHKEYGLVEEARRIEAGLATAEEWSWERSAQCLVDALQAHIGPVRQRPQRLRWERTGLTIAVPARN